jgi:hypothetical protein
MKTLYSLITIFAFSICANAQDWHITGNAATNASTNFIGTTDNVAFNVRTNNLVRLSINTAGRVGIGTTNPQDKFHVNGTGQLARFGTGTTATTNNYWFTGNDVGSYIVQKGNTTTPGSDKLRIQTSKSGLDVDFAQLIIDPNNGFAFIGTGSGNGNVGIGTSTPSYKLSVAGNADFTGAVSIESFLNVFRSTTGFPVASIENTSGASGLSDGLEIKAGANTISGSIFIDFKRPDGKQIGVIQQTSATSVGYFGTSDKRLKNIIGASQKGLPDLMKIKIYDYTFKSDPAKNVQTGFMAQELYEIFPQAVSKPRDNNEPPEKNPWMVDYGRVTPLIIKSVQEQQQMIDELKKQNEKLQKQIDELKAMLISKSSERVSDNQTAFK